MFNAPILASLLHFDERIYDIAIILKLWSKIHDLTGSVKMSSYGLSWLLIFYLQSASPPLLPPVNVFQSVIQSHYMNSLAATARFIPPTANRQGLGELLLGFFDFYSKFDFESYIISPLHGVTYRKDDLMQNQSSNSYQPPHSSEWLSDEELNKLICIRDPFHSSGTLMSPISRANFDEFRRKLCRSAYLYRNALIENGEDGQSMLSILAGDNYNLETSGIANNLLTFKPRHQSWLEQSYKIVQKCTPADTLNTVGGCMVVERIRYEQSGLECQSSE